QDCGSQVLPDRLAHCESASTADQEETQELEVVGVQGGYTYHGPGVTNNYCEVNALRLGLAAAKCSGDPGASVIEIIGDSQLLINHFTGSAVIRNPNLAAQIAEINRTLRGFNGIHWQHVKRNFNKAADRLANIAMDAKSSGRLVENANQLLTQRRD
uniref:RNase H type-1 domain-containing protein n=1 Tax=Globisporangium ultimum (strain ATCC 200006 / CBS 805.95 / DAOM BR144) TaxID=431595 RepID=K3X1E0_GLOUD